MSADTTTGILKTKGKNKGTFNFRVAMFQNAEKITENPNTENGFNNRTVRQLFGASKVHLNDQAGALLEAAKIEEAAGAAEYGIRTFDFSHLRFPKTSK